MSVSVRLPSCPGQNCGVQAMIETENHGMSLIRNRRGFLGVLFPALLAFVLIGPGAATAQAAVIAKKNGFASLAEYDGAWMNISMIMSGIDPQTKKFTEPPNQIKNEIAALKADKSVPEAEKKEGLAQLEAALKNAKPIQFKENIALVLKYFDQLAPLMREQDSELRPAD